MGNACTATTDREEFVTDDLAVGAVAATDDPIFESVCNDPILQRELTHTLMTQTKNSVGEESALYLGIQRSLKAAWPTSNIPMVENSTLVIDPDTGLEVPTEFELTEEPGEPGWHTTIAGNTGLGTEVQLNSQNQFDRINMCVGTKHAFDEAMLLAKRLMYQISIRLGGPTGGGGGGGGGGTCRHGAVRVRLTQTNHVIANFSSAGFESVERYTELMLQKGSSKKYYTMGYESCQSTLP